MISTVCLGNAWVFPKSQYCVVQIVHRLYTVRLLRGTLRHNCLLKKRCLIIWIVQLIIIFLTHNLACSIDDRSCTFIFINLPLPRLSKKPDTFHLRLCNNVFFAHESRINRIWLLRLHQEIPVRLFQPKCILSKILVGLIIGRRIDRRNVLICVPHTI